MQVFGIRHHGPGSARALVAALDALQPDAVLVELPADTAGVLPLCERPDMEPPVALLGYVRDQPERAAFWPLAAFSPEWCALRWALAAGAAIEPIDLPVAHALAMGGRPGAARDPLAELARAAGDPDPERWWEDVVEHRGGGADALAAVAEAMAAVRGAANAADCVALETVTDDGAGHLLAGPVVSTTDAAREAHMRRSVRRAMSRYGRVAVVVGAWHAPAVTPPFPPASVDARRLRGLPRVPVTCTWVPWTHRRLAAGTGYAAGVQAPGWYAHVHEHPGERGLVRWFALAGDVMRSGGRQASPDHLIAAVRTAGALAALRGRPRAGLDEVLDASVATLGEGREAVLSVLADRLVVGDGIGAVPADTPMVPLARDLAARQRQCRLKPTAERRVVELDVRTPNGLARSRLLHQLDALHVPWGVLVAGRGSSGSFRETWHVQWEPELSVLVVERSGDGTTVQSAAAARLLDDALHTDSVAGLVALVERALLADLPDTVSALVARLSTVTASAPDLTELMDALTPLARTVRYGDARGSDAFGLSALFDSLVVRVVAGLDRACRLLDDDASRVMAGRLTAVHAALALVDHSARHDHWPHAIERLVSAWMPPIVAGRAARLLHDSGTWPVSRTSRALSTWLGRGSPVASAGSFVEGLFGEGGSVLVHDHELIDVLDVWISSLDADDFTTAVVVLRRTFSSYEPADRRRIGEVVSGRFTPDATRSLGLWDPVLAARAMATLRHLLGVGE